MTQEELKRKTYLDKAIDWLITQKAAAETLGNRERQVRRLVRRYRQDGEGGNVAAAWPAHFCDQLGHFYLAIDDGLVLNVMILYFSGKI